MDVLFKGGALLYTQVTSVARLAAELPLLVVANAFARGQPVPEPGCTWLEGTVRHARRRPVANSFEYPVRMALVDLAQPPAWFSERQSRDHMNVQEARAFAGTDGMVLLLTNPVVAGYTQNPISVYYCYDADGRLAQAIAEVTNTPWGERVTFMFNPAGDASPKALHVSPFMDMDNTWHLKASPPPFLPGGAATAAADDADAVPGDGSRGNEGDKMQHASLSVSVLVTHPRLGAYFDAHLLLRRCPDDQQCLPEQGGLTALLRYGFMPHRVALWIYLQALRLAAKGCRVYAKPDEGYRAKVAASTGLAPCGAGVPYVWRPALCWPWNM